MSRLDSTDVLGQPTGISLTVTSETGFSPGSNGNGPNPADPPAGDIFDGEATRDNLFGHLGDWSVGAPRPLVEYTIGGLNSERLYEFTFSAGRLGVTDNRDTQYDVSGANSGMAILSVANNTTEVAQLTGIEPTEAGEIVLTIQPGPDNDNAEGFFYLGAMRLVEVLTGTLDLIVDRRTGEAVIENNTQDTFMIDYYQITSAGDSLDPDGWNSLQDQGLPGFPSGDGTGNGWEEGGRPDEDFLAEAYLQGNSSLLPAESLNLGRPYDPTVDAEDLEFLYRMADGPSVSGTVRFVDNPVMLGDVNKDGVVNGLDVDPFVDVLLNGPYLAEADMNEDQVVNGLDVDPFVAAVVGGGVEAVPEPATACLLSLAAIGLLLLRRHLIA